MEQNQSDAIAQAILEPVTREQQRIRRKQAHEAWIMLHKRKVAWIALCGCAIGGISGYFVGNSVAHGVLWGGIAGAAVGWTVLGSMIHRERKSKRSAD